MCAGLVRIDVWCVPRCIFGRIRTQRSGRISRRSRHRGRKKMPREKNTGLTVNLLQQLPIAPTPSIGRQFPQQFPARFAAALAFRALWPARSRRAFATSPIFKCGEAAPVTKRFTSWLVALADMLNKGGRGQSGLRERDNTWLQSAKEKTAIYRGAGSTWSQPEKKSGLPPLEPAGKKDGLYFLR